jgi:predicted MFS family arabinose efflux permease
VLITGIGFVLAAVVTPIVTERIAPRTWVLALLCVAAVAQLFPGALYTVPAVLVMSFFLGLASQGIKIVVDTLVQTNVDDAFRGRVFSLYDVIFNVAFVAAAAVGAVVLPDSGKSYVVLVAVALGYAATAAWYAHVTRAPRSQARSAEPLRG